MKIETAKARRLQNGGRKKEAVGHDDGRIEPQRCESGDIPRMFEIQRSTHGEAEFERSGVHRRGSFGLPPASRSGRLRVDASDIVPGGVQDVETGDGEFWRPHECNAQCHEAVLREGLRPGQAPDARIVSRAPR